MSSDLIRISLHFRIKATMDYIYQINISKGTLPKLPIKEAFVRLEGILGDKHEVGISGGPDKALCIFSLQEINKLKAEGHSIVPGSVGENLTISFEEYALLVPGVTLKIGSEVTIRITSFYEPAKNIAGVFTEGKVGRISQKSYPGCSRLYAKVLDVGKIKVGDTIEIIPS